MTMVLAAALGLLVAGPIGAATCGIIPLLARNMARRPEPVPPLTVVLLLLLVELRSGSSVLAALIAVADSLPTYRSLQTVSRVARVAGLASAISFADDRLSGVIAQLARSQRSGASLTDTVRRLLETEIASQRADRISKARSLPVRLMIPVTLLMLPGLILMLYAPSLLGMFDDLTGVLT